MPQSLLHFFNGTEKCAILRWNFTTLKLGMGNYFSRCRHYSSRLRDDEMEYNFRGVHNVARRDRINF
jgi:hypothetical protein